MTAMTNPKLHHSVCAALTPLSLALLAACADGTAPGQASLDSAVQPSLAVVVPPAPPSGEKSCDVWTVTVPLSSGPTATRTVTGADVRLALTGISTSDTRRIQVRGRHVRFDVNPRTFAVHDYTLTGATARVPITPEATRIFVSKVPQHGDVLNRALELRLNKEQLVLERAGTRQDMKIQAKNCNQGGIFQMEPEPATTEVNTLAAGFQYFRYDPASGRVFFTNGKILGYDSPQLAQRLSNTSAVATWRVQSGGRIGMVVGEDAHQALAAAR